MATVLGVLVAGGRGERLGLDRPKAMAMLSGRTLLDRALEILAAVCDHVVVAAPEGMRLGWSRTSAPVERVCDAGEGPLGGMMAGLEASPFERAVALGVDFPLMRSGTLAALIAHLGAFGSADAVRAAVVPAPGGVIQPLAAAYGPGATAMLADQLRGGERSPSRAVAALDPVILSDAELQALPGGLESFFNVNTPADLAEAARRIAARPGVG